MGLCVPSYIPFPLVLLCNRHEHGKPAFCTARLLHEEELTGMAVQPREMDWLSHHPWPLNRADPTVARRYLPQSHYPQGPFRPQHTFYSQDFYSMTHQSKKKRIEDDSTSVDPGTKPVQLQRRRVWRACESCRFVPHSALTPLSPVSNTFSDQIVDRRKKIKCDGCEPTCAQCQSSGSQCTWLQTKDRAALSRQ